MLIYKTMYLFSIIKWQEIYQNPQNHCWLISASNLIFYTYFNYFYSSKLLFRFLKFHVKSKFKYMFLFFSMVFTFSFHKVLLSSSASAIVYNKKNNQIFKNNFIYKTNIPSSLSDTFTSFDIIPVLCMCVCYTQLAAGVDDKSYQCICDRAL